MQAIRPLETNPRSQRLPDDSKYTTNLHLTKPAYLQIADVVFALSV